jgi:acetyl esterase/lipase
MIRLILVSILLLFSLLAIFRAPASILWYIAILVTEFCWVFFLLAGLLVFWKFGNSQYDTAATLIGIAVMVIYLVPIWQAFQLARKLDDALDASLGIKAGASFSFRPLQMLTGINAKKVSYSVMPYDKVNGLTLDFFPGAMGGKRPCIVVVHGGSWAAGDSRQLPELNSELAKAGYHVASINYRLAPKHRYPAPLEDVRTALDYLTAHAFELNIDPTRFVILGRSAGGEIALSAAYTFHDKRIKAVICFYGPTDMVWGYENPTSPLVLDSRKIMEDYLGGTLDEKRDLYIHSSATETVTSKTPATLLIFAENDPLVSPRHGNRLGVKLKAQGVKHFELYLPWATHGFDYTLNGPGGQISTYTVKRFLEAVVSVQGEGENVQIGK